MSAGDDRSPGPPSPSREPSTDDESLVTRFRTAEEGPLMFLREVLTSMAAVALVGLVLFAVSGVWPPMVAVESGSMDPNMQKGDLIFVTEPGRFMPGFTHEQTGVVTYEIGQEEGYKTFKEYGSVIVYDNPNQGGPPIIHRAMFWVEEGENWYDEANESYIQANNCAELPRCPAPHAGFVTKGDNNPYYDQASSISTVVKPDWVVGVARLRIPYLGWVRLGFSGAATAGPMPGVVGAEAAGSTGAGLGPAASVTDGGLSAGTQHLTATATAPTAVAGPSPSSPQSAASGAGTGHLTQA